MAEVAEAEPTTGSGESGTALSAAQVQRAIRLSYGQAMLGAVYGASTGGMFLIGYALMLGATEKHIGRMSTIPMLCVGVQLVGAALIERGVSRRLLTCLASLGNVLGWLLIILIPYALPDAGRPLPRITALICIITLVTLFGNVAGNARGSWLGDLIPAGRRGSFFGRLTMFGALIASVFAILEGRFLDIVKGMGISAFTLLFGFGVVVGLVNALLFLPQADVKIHPRGPGSGGFLHDVRATFGNRALVTVMAFALLWAMQSISGPFFATYMIRDLRMSFLSIGLVNCVVVVAMVVSAPFWGRIVDRFGCRAILTICSFTLGVLQLVWLGVDSAREVYLRIPIANLVAGTCIGGVSVALATLLYKVTPSAGRAVQFAVYSTLVTVGAAPMPEIGGHLTDWLGAIMPGVDLRVTFFAAIPPLLLAALVARWIREERSCRTRDLLRWLPGEVLDHVQRQVQRVLSGGREAG